MIRGSAVSMPDRPISKILDDIVRNVQEIVHCEIRLAKAELRLEGQKLLGSTLWMAAGALVGIMGAATLVAAVVAGLALIVPVWEAAVLVGVGLGIVSATALLIGSRKFSMLQPPLTKTMEALSGPTKGTGAWISSND